MLPNKPQQGSLSSSGEGAGDSALVRMDERVYGPSALPGWRLTSATPTAMIICLGQLIVDFFSQEDRVPLSEVTRFAPYLGGSAANVAVGLHHHGVPVQLWSRVGQDAEGDLALDQLAMHGLDGSMVVRDTQHPTRFTRIGSDAQGRRVMEIHHWRSADQYLASEDFPPDALAEARIIYISGTVLLSERGFRTAVFLSEQARGHGCLVAFDPNIRPNRTPHPERIRDRLAAVRPFVDVLQTNRRDWKELWGDRSPEDMQREGLGLLSLTDGASGATLLTPHHSVPIPAEAVSAVDVTGTGDAFLAALLAQIVAADPSVPLSKTSPEALREWGRCAAGWGAKVALQRGATTAYERLDSALPRHDHSSLRRVSGSMEAP